MNPDPVTPENLDALERRLHLHLAVMTAVAFGVGFLAGGWTWGASGAIGCVAAMLYYFLLGQQVRRQLARGHQPGVSSLVVSLMGRQAVCAFAVLVCFAAFGTAWWACLATLFVARHWVVVVASRPRFPLAPVVQA